MAEAFFVSVYNLDPCCCCCPPRPVTDGPLIFCHSGHGEATTFDAEHYLDDVTTAPENE